ncbi:DUF721 domain-containing protein [Candidatus Hoaglandella endobia]|uniref:DUF721 domain-containing protein n=1 Tax=Candidatus Hoaglandella endobia TaxID=1778263 RepID=A0A143WWJ7_9ENTR|nr:DciA family protein [Candidatus Hoaglandella endobia]CUX97284.1 hypothetical protein TPER_HE00366 [Candidatus Hoaglandella endobia]
MRASRPYPINMLFIDAAETSSVSLVLLQQRAIMLLKLNRTVSVLLPITLRPWCRVANFRQSVLVLETANASWKMRLRYEQTKLLSALRAQSLPLLSAIDIRINPSLAKGANLSKKNNSSIQQSFRPHEEEIIRLSMKSAVSIINVAARSKGTLKSALERLAKLVRENSDHTTF